jgi:hypothetical protein
MSSLSLRVEGQEGKEMKMKRLFTIFLCIVLLAGCSQRKRDGYEPYDDSYIGNYYVSDGGDYSILEESQSMKANSRSPQLSDEKLIYRSSVSLETKDYAALTDELEELMRKYGAITQSMSESGGTGRTFHLTVRVPAQHFDEFVQGLRDSSGSVINISTNVDNITEQYNNNDIRIRALETQHTRLLQLLENAKDLSDIIQIEERLSEVEIELTQLQTYKNRMDADVTYSTIELTIREVQTYSETSFWQKLVNAFNGSRSNFVRSIEDFVIDVIYMRPHLLVWIAVILLLKKPVLSLKDRIFSKKAAKVIKKETPELTTE